MYCYAVSDAVITTALWCRFKTGVIFWPLFLIPNKKCYVNWRALVSTLGYWILTVKYAAISLHKALKKSDITIHYRELDSEMTNIVEQAKYIVYEDSLLFLFKKCPVCNSEKPYWNMSLKHFYKLSKPVIFVALFIAGIDNHLWTVFLLVIFFCQPLFLHLIPGVQ